MRKPNIGKKSKRPDNRPARTRYWMSKHLRRNKIRNIMRSTNLTKEEATKLWLSSNRQGRIRTTIRKAI